MFERFTDRARRVLVLAQDEARLLNHDFIGTEHIFLGLLREDEGVAAHALRSLGIGLEATREKMAETVGPAGSPTSGSPPFTPRAKQVLELSLREALGLGHHHIGTEHLLLGIVREGEGVAAQVLVGLGADLGRVRQSVLDLLQGEPAATVRQLLESRRSEPTQVDPPRCPRCMAGLGENVAYRVVMASGEGEDDEPARFVVVYCRRCGTALGTAS